MQKAEDDQGFDTRTQGAKRAGYVIEDDPADQHRTAAESVRQWTIEELPYGGAEEERTQGQLHIPRRYREVLRDSRQARQIHVDQHRPERGQ